MKKRDDFEKSQTVKRIVKRNPDDVHRNRHIWAKVDTKLQSVYDRIVKEGTPDRFAKLLKHLERRKDEEEST
jgi:hypothetical protein